jgi:hypothetical protein
MGGRVRAERRQGIASTAAFAYTMLGTTPKGDAYTASELNAMARDAGFRAATVTALTAGPESLVTFEQ